MKIQNPPSISNKHDIYRVEHNKQCVVLIYIVNIHVCACMCVVGVRLRACVRVHACACVCLYVYVFFPIQFNHFILEYILHPY